MSGPPGRGKSLLAIRVPTILPGATLDEALETTKIHSSCGLLPKGQALVAVRLSEVAHNLSTQPYQTQQSGRWAGAACSLFVSRPIDCLFVPHACHIRDRNISRGTSHDEGAATKGGARAQ